MSHRYDSYDLKSQLYLHNFLFFPVVRDGRDGFVSCHFKMFHQCWDPRITIITSNDGFKDVLMSRNE